MGNPDFLSYDFNTLTIDEARDISRIQERKGFADGNETARKFFVVGTNIITDEAQNALLKVFEEPTPGTHFFILASQNTYLPTFLSRLSVIRTEKGKSESKDEFLKKSLSERLVLVTKLAGDISDEKQVKQDAIDLVNSIEAELFEHDLESNAKALRECQFARTALFSRGAMIKMILENLMLQI